MIDERTRDKFPLFSAFGDEHEFLSHDESIAATSHERVRSIWPFLYDRVMKFDRTLKPRERANFDPEDVMLELYGVLIEKDGGWQPEKGRYITYAGTIVDRELCSIRDRSRTVESPRNSYGRMKEYAEEEAAETITDRRRFTAAQIKGTNCIAPMPPSPGDAFATSVATGSPFEHMTKAETRSTILEALSSSIRLALTPFESAVIGRIYGLWGSTPQTAQKVAWEMATENICVRRAKCSALAKIKDHLTSVSHPVTAPW